MLQAVVSQVGECGVVGLEDVLGTAVGDVAKIAAGAENDIRLGGKFLEEAPVTVVGDGFGNHETGAAWVGNGDSAVEADDVVAEEEGTAEVLAVLAQVVVEVEAVERVFLDGLGVELVDGIDHEGMIAQDGAWGKWGFVIG